MELQSRRKLWHTLLTAASFSGVSYLFIFHKSFLSWLTSWFQWCPTAPSILEEAEKKILSNIKKPIELLFIKIPGFSRDEEEYNIRTLIVKNESNKNTTPLVLLHGFASGVGLWILNLEKLSENRTVYALDLLGFGRSSRPQFSNDAELAEQQFVESIEQWRKELQLNHFILLGHSMGGFLASSYAIKYPERVEHLILADPWGFPEPDLARKRELPLWIKVIAAVLKPFNPLAGLRAAGPWGPKLVQRLRPDIIGKFEDFVQDTSDVSNYIYHCNAQTPSGEAGFKAMEFHFGHAKQPMIKRITELKQEIPITFIYGSRSWIDHRSGTETATLRSNSSVEVKVIQGAGHHVYADRSSEFNKLVCNTCKRVDQGHYTFLSSDRNNSSRESSDSEEKEANEIKDSSQLPVVV